jgi:hypothetical protein
MHMKTPSAGILFSAFVAFAFAGPARGQDLTHKAPPQAGPIAIVGAMIHPVSQPPFEGAIVFDKGTITLLAPGQMPAPSPDVRVIDGKGKHVYPGLISPWTQVGLTEIQSVAATQDLVEVSSISPEARPAIAVNPDSTLIPVTRSNGIMLAGIFPDGQLVSGQVSVIRLDGWTMADMTVRGSSGIVLRWPQMRTISAWWMSESEDEQRKNITRNLERLRTVFDTAQAYANAKDADPTQPTDLRWEAMRPLFDAEADKDAAAGRDAPKDAPSSPPARLFVLANDVDQISAAVAFAKERGVRLVIVGGRDAAMCAPLLKEHNVPVILTGAFVMPRRDDADYDEGYTRGLKLHEAGITFAISTADDIAHERNLPYSAAIAAAHGLPKDIALRSITLSAAEILGVADRYGSLESGKSATLIITSGDPLEVTTQIEGAFIDGREIDLSNKQTKLYDKYRDRYQQMGVIPKDEAKAE